MKDLSRRATAYVLSVILVGAVIAGGEFWRWSPTNGWGLTILSLLASLTLIFKVLGATERSHYNLSFLIYGFTFILLGVPATIIVILISNLVEWLWHGYPHWYIQPFNIASYIIAFFTASIIYDITNPRHELFSFAGINTILIAAAVFVLLNHLMVGVVIWLARGQNFRQSGVFSFLPLMIDFTMIGMGVAGAWAWMATPYGVEFMLIPLYLIYSTLRVPALERKTELDPKTEVFNAGYFSEALEDELNRANRFHRPLSVIMADMDLLRHVNNTYGHLAGDVVLKGVAAILRTSVREYDIVSRFGGEEFAILLPETEAERAYMVGERLRQEIEAASFPISTSVRPIEVTMSFGVASREDAPISAEALVHHADLALYEAKASGRNCTRLFGRQVDTSQQRREANEATAESAQATDMTTAPSGDHKVEVQKKETPSAALTYVMEHSRNVARYAVLVAEELGLSPESVENVRKAGLLHDIGKLGIPESVLFKPERLTKDEYEQVKRHVEIGAELIEGCHSLRSLIPFVRYHHERFDGHGYPDRLAGAEIPLEARILCLADAVEAMASDRPYSRAKTADEILAEVKEQAGKQFDPQVCEAFCRMVAAAGKKSILNSARAVLARQMSDEHAALAGAHLVWQQEWSLG